MQVNRVHSNESSQSLAARITQAASKQTYYTVRYLVDRPLIPDAYRAYAYFRWVDDYLDQEDIDKPQRMAATVRLIHIENPEDRCDREAVFQSEE